MSWSRIQFSASCYRTCETSGTLELQITRSGRSGDPAYVTVQVGGPAHLEGPAYQAGSAFLDCDFLSVCRWRRGGRPGPAETSHTAAVDWCSSTQVGRPLTFDL